MNANSLITLIDTLIDKSNSLIGWKIKVISLLTEIPWIFMLES